mmetsp:Transcript_27430/g.27309  ORF Transcript_27430/g.27309 Transcript_27430/m.27309 type:complete len:92 (-) Transcript_27430:363-638(-)
MRSLELRKKKLNSTLYFRIRQEIMHLIIKPVTLTKTIKISKKVLVKKELSSRKILVKGVKKRKKSVGVRSRKGSNERNVQISRHKNVRTEV